MKFCGRTAREHYWLAIRYWGKVERSWIMRHSGGALRAAGAVLLSLGVCGIGSSASAQAPAVAPAPAPAPMVPAAPPAPAAPAPEIPAAPAPPPSPAPMVPTAPDAANGPAIETPPVAGLNDGSQTQADTAPQLTGKLDRIEIKGNVNISTPAIMAVMTQKVGEPYSADSADRDRAAIKNMGYFNGDVVLTATKNATGGIDETYTVTENPLIKKIVFTANTPSGVPSIAPAILLSKMSTKEGQVLNTNTLVKDLDLLFNHNTGYVSSQGYIMDVSADINIDPTDGTLTIPLVEAYIQAIKITGNKKTKTIVVTREMRSQAGQVLNQRKLNSDLTKVYNLGLFDTVGPADIEPTDVGKVVINIPVTEKRSGQVSVGVGYSSTEKLVGRAELAENNFRGLGERISLQFEVGGITSDSSVELGYFEPYLDKRHTSLSVDLYNKVVYRFSNNFYSSSSTQTGDSSQYTEKRKGGTVSLNRPLSDTTSAGLSLRMENVKTNNYDVPVQYTYIRQDGTVAAIGAQFTNNTKDQDFAPAAGGFRSFSYEIGTANTSTVANSPSPLAPGRHNFGKLGIDLRQYISLQGPRKAGDIKEPKRVFAVRLLMGFSNKNIPFFEQYFLGGADDLRGYDQDRYWGNNLLLGQAELRIPIGKGGNLQGVILGDIGDAWGSIYQGQGLSQHDSLELRGDYGVGIRLVTPIGPIRVDYAIPTTGGGGRTQFSIGQSF